MNVKKMLKTVGTVVIFSVLIVGFAFFGMNRNMLSGVQSNTVVAAGSHVVDKVDFKRQFEGARQDASQQQKRQISTEEMAAAGVDVNLLNQLKTTSAMSVVLDHLGVRPGLEMMADEMRKIPQFLNPVSGGFDPDAFKKTLRENDLTVPKFNAMISDQIAFRQLASAVEAGNRPPAILAAYQALMTGQKRDVSVLYITPSMIPAIAPPTDAQLTAFMTSNADQGVRIPETRVLTIVRFKLADVLPTVTPTEADIQKLVDFNKDQQATPETRTLVQINAKDQATAQSISTQLMQGKDPDTVAKATGSTVVRLENKPKTAIADPKAADAAFSLAAGQTSGPIQGALGFSVVKVTAITPAKLPDMKALRTAAETQAKQRAAQMKITEQANKFEDAINNGTDMADAARAVGAHVIVTPAVAPNGMVLPPFGARVDPKTAKPVDGITPRLLQEVGALQANEKSDIVKEGDGDYFMVRVDKINPSSMPSLAEARPVLTPIWTAQQANIALKAKADELAAKLRQGGAFADIAKQAGGSLVTVPDVNVIQGQAMAQKYGDPLIRGAVSAKKGEYFTGQAPPAEGSPPTAVRAFVATVTEIHQADTATAAPEGQKALPQIAQAMGNELEDETMAATARLVQVKTYPDRARAAIGLEPLPAPGAAPKAAPKAPAGGAAKK